MLFRERYYENSKFQIQNSNIMNRRNLDIIAHAVLYFGFFVGGLAVLFSRFNENRQFLLITLLVLFYLLWGYLYHDLRKDLTRKLFGEYLIIALIALAAGFLVFLS